MKRLILTMVFSVAAAVGIFALTPKEAYREICNLPTMQQSMPVTELTVGSDIVLINAQTAQSVATDDASLVALENDIMKIVSEIPDIYYVAGADYDGSTVVYFADRVDDSDLYNVLRVEFSPNLYFGASLGQVSEQTVKCLRQLIN